MLNINFINDPIKISLQCEHPCACAYSFSETAYYYFLKFYSLAVLRMEKLTELSDFKG